ncbi:MAG TPA: glutamine synthetase family protein [Candidatus Lokiarchaeia archaeon]|nr:glutamine synthetase family protein [Candidatus Lokiarchaeia archaeon]
MLAGNDIVNDLHDVDAPITNFNNAKSHPRSEEKFDGLLLLKGGSIMISSLYDKDTITAVIQDIQEKNIKFIRLQFTDINGRMKSFAIQSNLIEGAFDHGINFDGSSVTGYHAIEESDMVAMPDPTTYAMVPWREVDNDGGTCRLICDVFKKDDTPFEGDSRFILKNTLKRIKDDLGYSYFCAPEMEFFLLKQGKNEVMPNPMDLEGYFDLTPGDEAENLRREMVLNLEKFNIPVEKVHHEVSRGQHEIDIQFTDALRMADWTVTLKNVVKSVAAFNGYQVTFMPKPYFGINGSGMHVHQSFSDDSGKDVFYGEDPDTGYLSDIALGAIAGQLQLGRPMCAVLASWPNSYKRLVPGFEAPVYVAWGLTNRSPMIRVPDFRSNPKAARFETRCPDPAGNPYLQFAVLAYTAYLGIKNNWTPPPPTDLNLYELSDDKRKELGIPSLPGNLAEALHEFWHCPEMLDLFGSMAFENFHRIKLAEWKVYSIQISDWEFNRYLSL